MFNLKPNQEMKKEIKLKKGHANTFLFKKGCNVKSLEIDEKRKTVSIDWHEEEKPAMKVGEWWLCMANGTLLLITEDGCDNLCIVNGILTPTGIKPYSPLWRKADSEDMQEVEKLLIKEAEKYKGSQIKCIRGQIDTVGIIDDNAEFVLREDELFAQNRGNGFTLFDFKTGKWAEIVKKPLYVNQYGTEFFEGDECFFVRKDTLGLETYVAAGAKNMKEGQNTSEIMTRKECYKWIAENYDWLSENL